MRIILSLLATLLVLSNCSTSKFDYQTAYKFSHYDYKPGQTKVEDPISLEQQNQFQSQEREKLITGSVIPSRTSLALLASTKPVTSPVPSIPSDINLSNFATTESAASMADQYKSASKQERKLIRKKVKLDFKSLRLQMKKAKKDATSQDVVFNRKMWIGAIILGAGILTAILASGEIGAIAIIVGIALLAWGLIEQV